MKNEFYKQINEIFIKHPNEKDEYRDLYECVQLILKAIDLQEQSNEVNKKLNELNSDKKEEK
ncbi:MAG: hypothetical protein IKJ30_00380 [Bacilli bacterium]|nr:hypothetical protein [Bacilli bacterium]